MWWSNEIKTAVRRKENAWKRVLAARNKEYEYGICRLKMIESERRKRMEF